MNIGLIGKGSIGTFLLKKINEEQLLPNHRITAIFDERESSRPTITALAEQYRCEAVFALKTFLEKDLDLIIECATIDVARKYSRRIVKHTNLLLISIGVLADTYFADELEKFAKENGQKVFLPSGAIGGLDVIKAAQVAGELDSVTLTSRKPAKALTDKTLLEEKIVFEGFADDAIAKFPKNANVAIALSLAGLGARKTNVKIIADPIATKNIHHIEAEGGFGQFEVTITNNPSPDNAKTSYLTALSILSVLHSIEKTVVINS
ncbi:aspartate dehydrogenase [Sporosarcina sp. Sa2YVA2]|uniref:L-aspartate dehydrogenase n=1 Tax=Sporosarcina quadrami TaxID=2762234 RepID=A0ABR8UE53_9BACL|nr:aspartate dehydrogenase [Sporosarcina quadrami]MBD7985984.1 aspartate dehydrogenase [Sporosarcina quadrami]